MLKDSSLSFIREQNVAFDLMNYRRSRPEVFCKKRVLKNFEKFTEKYRRQSLFF